MVYLQRRNGYANYRNDFNYRNNFDSGNDFNYHGNGNQFRHRGLEVAPSSGYGSFDGYHDNYHNDYHYGSNDYHHGSHNYGSFSGGGDCCPLVVDPYTLLALKLFLAAAVYLLNTVITMSTLMMARRRRRKRSNDFHYLLDIIFSGKCHLSLFSSSSKFA